MTFAPRIAEQFLNAGIAGSPASNRLAVKQQARWQTTGSLSAVEVSFVCKASCKAGPFDTAQGSFGESD